MCSNAIYILMTDREIIARVPLFSGPGLSSMSPQANKINNIKGKRNAKLKKTTRSKTTVDSWHLEVKQKDISLTKSYCITVSVQKISSIHKFIFKIKQILGSH